MWYWWPLIILGGLTFYFWLRLRERSRRALFQVLTHLILEDMDAPVAPSLEAIHQRYQKLSETLEKARLTARQAEEITKCEKLGHDISEWQIQKVQAIYKEKLEALLRLIKKENPIEEKLRYLFEARTLIQDGILEKHHLKKIDKLIVHLYVKKARTEADGLPEKQKLHLYDQTMEKILNCGIEDQELEQMEELKAFIKEYDDLFQKLTKTGNTKE